MVKSFFNIKPNLQEKAIELVLLLCTLFTLLITVVILWCLLDESFQFFAEVPILDFLTGTRWEPLLEPKSFGVLPLVCGTLLVVVCSGALALPIGLVTAIYLSEYSRPSTRDIMKPILELLAGIPSIVYGYFALTFITPLLGIFFPNIQVFNAASASIVVAIMILPLVASLCDDAFRSVPPALRQGGYAMGATTYEVVTQLVVPATFSRILAAFILAISRAIGETMAVTLAAGATPNLTINPLESIQTMTSYIVQISLGDISAEGIEFKSSMAVGALLFFMTFGLNAVAHKVVSR